MAPPLIDVTRAEALRGHRVYVEFEDGRFGVYGVAPAGRGGVRRDSRLGRVRDHGGGGQVLAWLGDAVDIAPEGLYARSRECPMAV